MARTDCPLAAACRLMSDTDPAWKFCPKCGTRCKELFLEPEIDNAAEDEDGLYRMPLLGAEPGLEVEYKDLQNVIQFKGIERTPFGLALKMDISRLADRDSGHILITSDDGRRESLWEPRSLRTRAVRITRRIAELSVVAVPGVAIFLGELLQAEIVLENRGSRTAKFGPPRVPVGFELVDPMVMAGFELAPKELRALKIRRKIGAAPSNLVFTSPTGEEIVEVRLLPVTPAPARTPPGLVVSIDFGTSSTSVFCLETRTGIVEPISLLGDGKERRDTLLFANLNVDRRLWQIFPKGIASKDLIHDLKTLVRGRKEGSTDQLEFYLRALLQNGIAAYLEGRNPGDERTVEFVFTVPVLDGSEGRDYLYYRETLLNCARAAGYEDRSRGWTLRSMLEPDGGALEVISIPEISREMTDGERILILDVGGGTTDVTLGKVRFVDQPHLEEVENASVVSNEDQFGGEAATYALGWRWVKADTEGTLPEGPDRIEVGIEHEREKINRLIDYGWISDPSRTAEATNSWKDFDEIKIYEPNADHWGWRFSDLWDQVKLAKHFISDESEKWKEQPWKVAPYRFDSRRPSPALEWKITPGLLDSALRDPVRDICSGIEQFLKLRSIPLSDIDHVAMIGGSARLQPLREAIEKLFPKRLLPLGSYVDVAVCRGAARLHRSSPPILPVGFELVVGDLPPIELSKPGASLAKVIRRIQPLESSRDARVRIEISCVLPDRSRLTFIPMSIDKRFEGEIVGSVSSGAVRIEIRSNQGEKVEREVRLL